MSLYGQKFDKSENFENDGQTSPARIHGATKYAGQTW